jgi:hypothetical protein
MGVPPFTSFQYHCEHICGASHLQFWANAPLAETKAMPAKASIAAAMREQRPTLAIQMRKVTR